MSDLSTMDTRMLKALRDLCPKKEGESITISALGQNVTLTVKERRKADAELKRRKAVEA